MSFSNASDTTVWLLTQATWVSERARVGYMLPLFEATKGKRVTIATLNYDNVVELACHAAGRECSVGLDRWNAKGAFDFTDADVALMKLHGSVDWMWSHLLSPAGYTETEVVPTPMEPDGFSGHHPVVVFGQRDKLTTAGPFLDLLASFRRELAAASHVVVAGYSFRDEHINHYLHRWLAADSANRMTIINPGVLDEDWSAELEEPPMSQQVTVVRQALGSAISSGTLPID